MSVATQIAAVTLLNLRTLPQRVGNSLVIVIGIAGVVAVFISTLSMSVGFRQTVLNSGRADRVIVLSPGADSEASSSLSRENALAIKNASGLKKATDGKPFASAELILVANVSKKTDGSDAFVTLRGVAPEAFALRPEIKLIAGRMFRPAVHELLVGESAQSEFLGLDVGSQIKLREGDWTVTGIFTSGHSYHDSELLADADTVLSAYKGNSFNSVTAMLDSEQSFATFKDALTSDPTVVVDVRREPEYFATASKPLNRVLNLVAYAIGGIMAIGALFGALNTMYSAVSARSTEIATLRAIGFGGGVVVVSVLIEALLLSLLGACIGVAIAYVAFNGQAISTLGGSMYDSQLVYSLTVSADLVAIGIALACALGFLGGLFPAIRAARLPVASALRGA